jgi:hypothetical protein
MNHSSERHGGAGRLVGWAAGITLAGLLLAGCTATNSESLVEQFSTGGDSSPMQGQPDAAVEGDTSAAEISVTDRSVVTTGSVTLTVSDPITVAQDAVTIVEQAGGRVDSRTENPETEDRTASASLTLRIPAGDLDRTLDELRALGTVNQVTLNASDVTQQSADVNARVSALTTSVDRLLGLMTQATSTADLIAIESELSTRQADLESMTSQRDYLSDQIEYSTITLELTAKSSTPPGAPDTFWSAAVAGWAALVTALGAALIGLGFALPWLVIVAVILGIGFLIRRVLTGRGNAT